MNLLMSTLDTGLTLIRTASRRVSAANGWMGNAFKGWMPTGLYARALLIMIVPMVVLQSVVAFVFMERHWNTVTRRLSAAVVQDIASLIDVYKGYPQDKDRAQLRRIAQQRLQLVVDFLPVGDMPPPGPKPFFSLLDQTLSVQLGRQIGRPFWIDTVGRSNLVEIRIQLDDAVMRDLRPAQRGLCLEFGDLPVLDGRHLVDPADRLGAVPAQPDQADPAPGGRRRKLRQGPRSAELPPPRRARSAPRRAGLPGDEIAHRALDRAAHRDAGRRIARSAHHPDPLQARTGADRRQSRSRRHAQGCRRDVRHAGGLSRLRARRQRRDTRSRPTWRWRWRNCAATPSATATPRPWRFTACRS